MKKRHYRFVKKTLQVKNITSKNVWKWNGIIFIKFLFERKVRENCGCPSHNIVCQWYGDLIINSFVQKEQKIKILFVSQGLLRRSFVILFGGILRDIRKSLCWIHVYNNILPRIPKWAILDTFSHKSYHIHDTKLWDYFLYNSDGQYSSQIIIYYTL